MTEPTQRIQLLSRAEYAEGVLEVTISCGDVPGDIERIQLWDQDTGGDAYFDPERAPGADGGQTPIATVINDNQPGWTAIIEMAPNVTLEVGTKLFLAPDADAERVAEDFADRVTMYNGNCEYVRADLHAELERRIERALALATDTSPIGRILRGEQP